MTDPEREFSECVVYNRGERVELEWTAHGRTANVLVSEPLIEQWVKTENERRALKVLLREIVDEVDFSARPPEREDLRARASALLEGETP